MAIQKRNDEMIALASADFQRRYESSFAWRTACSMFQMLTGLRGFWPMSAQYWVAYDQSGNGRTLSYNGNPIYDFDSLAPYIVFDGTGDYLSRVDAAGLDISGTEAYIGVGHRGLTMGGWFYPGDATATDGLISKWDSTTPDYSYILYLNGTVAGDPVTFAMSDDGTNTSSVNSTTGYTTNTWQFMAGRFNDAETGEELAVWLNDEKTTAASARASIFNSAADFNIGGWNNGSGLYTGRASLCFLCAAALDDATIWALYQHTRALFRV